MRRDAIDVAVEFRRLRAAAALMGAGLRRHRYRLMLKPPVLGAALAADADFHFKHGGGYAYH
jgi:hypothetical protein